MEAKVMEEQREREGTGPAELIADQRSGPGLLVLTSSLQLLHMNPQAIEMSRFITHAENGKSAQGVLPTSVTELCSEIQRILKVRTEAKDWEQFQLRKIVGNGNDSVLLRAFGLPDRTGFEQSRILVMMEEVGRNEGNATEQAKHRFRLTDREQSVVQNLAKGWTNKEIANELGITEQTVKEHIKHIMQKTKTSTRTGILVKILNA